MERSSFIKLLEEYKSKAIQEHYKECKVQASLLVAGEFRQAILELEEVSKKVCGGFEAVNSEFEKITKDNTLSDRYGRTYLQYPTTNILNNVIEGLASKIRNANTPMGKENEIRNKFDAAIKAAKASRSAARLKELANALGIETPEIVVDTGVKVQVDTEFVKEKIKSVLLLK
jgi:hypothetical protein